MKKTTKLVAVLSAFLALSFAGCSNLSNAGDSQTDETQTEETKEEEKEEKEEEEEDKEEEEEKEENKEEEKQEKQEGEASDIPTAPAGKNVDLSTAVKGYGANMSVTGNVLTIETPTGDNKADDYNGYSQVQIPINSTAKKIAVILKNTGKTKMNFQIAGSNPWGNCILSDADAKYIDDKNEKYVLVEYDVPANSAFFTIGSCGVETYVINVYKIVLIGVDENAVQNPTEEYVEYSLTTTADAGAGQFAIKLQLDSDTASETSPSYTISNLEMKLTIGAEEVTVTKDSVTLSPSEYDEPKWGKTNTRFVVYDNAVPAGTQVKIKCINGTVDSTKKSSIVFALQQEGGSYSMLAGNSDMWKPIFQIVE